MSLAEQQPPRTMMIKRRIPKEGNATAAAAEARVLEAHENGELESEKEGQWNKTLSLSSLSSWRRKSFCLLVLDWISILNRFNFGWSCEGYWFCELTNNQKQIVSVGNNDEDEKNDPRVLRATRRPSWDNDENYLSKESRTITRARRRVTFADVVKYGKPKTSTIPASGVNGRSRPCRDVARHAFIYYDTNSEKPFC